MYNVVLVNLQLFKPRNYIVLKMSFFIKGKRKTVFKPVLNGVKSPAKKIKEDELTSSESEYNSEPEVSDDEEETAQEKRLRLAKVYLQEIENEEKERLDDNDDLVSTRLKEDYLKQTGKFRKEIADSYTGPDLDNISCLRSKEHKKPVTCLCISFDSKYCFSGSKDGGLVKWSILEKKKVNSLPFAKRHLVKIGGTIQGHSSEITCIAISDDFKFLAVGDESNDIQIWNPDTLTHIKTLKSHRNSMSGLAFRKDTHCLYSCSKDRSVKVWALDEMAYLETLFGHQDAVTALDALTRERAITAGGTDMTIRIWKIAEESQLIFNVNGNVDCVKLINEENFLSAGDAGEICVWGANKKKPLCFVKDAHGVSKINNQPAWISCVATFVNADIVATGSNNGFINVWKLSNSCRNISKLFTIPMVGFVNSLSFTNDGTCLVAGVGKEHRCGRWDTVKEATNGVYIIPLIKSV